MLNICYDDLNEMINIKKLSYEEIGRQFGYTGQRIKQYAKKLGIPLPVRSRRHDNDYEYICLGCGKKFNPCHFDQKFCSNKCQHDYQFKIYIDNWKKGLESGYSGKSFIISNHIRKYLLDKVNHKCEICGWNKINPITGISPLQIHHIDGNPMNNSEDNLQVLCPNCHSLTETYMALNRKSPRFRK